MSLYHDAERLIFLNGARIVDVGTHDELVVRPGVYQNLYNEQFKSAREQAMEAHFA